MKKSIVITDLTRMNEGRVCIAGYDEKGTCIRPTLPPPGIMEDTLYNQKRPIVFPFAIVEFDLLQPTPQPPHTEDIRYDPKSVRLIGQLPDKDKPSFLDKTLSENVQAIFEQPVLTNPGFYVLDGRGPRSLGTIRPKQLIQVIYEKSPDNKWSYRLRFMDNAGTTYRLTVTDLAWRYYCDYNCKQGQSLTTITNNLMKALNTAKVYFRMGLSRGWDKYPGYCFLQITGIYSFPDYLNGKTFADFTSDLRAKTPF